MMNQFQSVLEEQLDQLIDTAITEDIGCGDITSSACLKQEMQGTGTFFLKQAGVIAGLPLIEMLYKKIDPSIEMTLFIEDGTYHRAGTIIAKIKGSAISILSGERIALNLLQHASGIATATSSYVRKIKGLNCQILDTRKTLPGLRALEKYAFTLGGGTPHRMGLYDRFIIKTNHVNFIEQYCKTPIKEAVNLAKYYKPNTPIEIEIKDIMNLDEALATEADVIILSRMAPDTIKKCVKKIRTTKKKVYVESLGTITLDTIRAFAETGVDGITIGSLTHSIEDVDIGMRLSTSYV